MLCTYNKSIINDKNYYNFLYNKRIALVGPSSNTLNTNQGDLIDSYDLVIRLNKTFEIPENIQKDVGKRIDVLYNSMNTSDYPKQNDLTKQRLDNLRINNCKYISCPYPFIYPFENDILKFLDNNQNKIPYHIINLNLYKYLVSSINGRPYTGTCAIMDLISFPIKELYITGIDCYINKYYNEYRKISNSILDNLRNNHIHNNYSQLMFIKKLAYINKKIKLDKFLENFFFEKESKIYNNISLKPFISNNNNNLNKLTKNKHIYYTNKNINNSNLFLVKHSLNYENISNYNDMYINIINKTDFKSFDINNNILIFMDFNDNIKVNRLLKENTSIKHLYSINNNIFNYIKQIKYFKSFNFILLNIFICIILFNKIIYVDQNLINQLSQKEKDIVFYLNYVNKINIV